VEAEALLAVEVEDDEAEKVRPFDNLVTIDE
jgi:hypothetical protein